MKSKILNKLSLLLILSYAAYMLMTFAFACFDEYPREYRDAACVQLTECFVRGINPYTRMDANFQVVNVYTPLNSLIAAFVVVTTGAKIATVHYVLDFIYIVLTAFVLAYQIYNLTEKSKYFFALTFSVALSIGYRMGFISAVPDHLGVLLNVVAVLMVCPKMTKKRVLCISLLTSLSFYAKQYFLAISAPIFLYIFLNSKKMALRYFIYTAVITLSSFFIICKYNPYFIVDTVLLMLSENGGSGIDVYLYSLKQFIDVSKSYCFEFLFAIGLFILFKKNLRYIMNKVGIYILCVFVMGMLLIKLGQNNGAYLSYHISLLIPYVIVLSIFSIYEYEKKYKFMESVTPIIAVLMCVSVLWGLRTAQILNENEKSQWTEVYESLDQYVGSSGSIYASPVLAYYMMDRGYEVTDNGHGYMDDIINGVISLDSNILTQDFIDKAYEQHSLIVDEIQSHKYNVIVTDNEKNVIHKLDVSKYYKCVGDYNLRTGSQIKNIKIWI